MTRRIQLILGAVSSTLVVLLTFFLASGISQLLGSWLQSSAVPRYATHSLETLEHSPASPDVLRELHAFDSSASLGFSQETGQARSGSHSPLNAPHCEDVLITVVSDYADPRFSFVTLRTPNASTQHLARLGDVTEVGTLVGIAQHPRTLSPTVWFMGDELCQAELFQPTPRAAAQPKHHGSSSTQARTPQAPGFAQHVKQRGANDFEVDRAAAEEILTDPSRFMSGVQALPYKRNGALAGLSLRRLSASSPLSALGLKSGDLLTSLNGSPLADPEKMLLAYASLRSTERLRLEVERGGTPFTIEAWIH